MTDEKELWGMLQEMALKSNLDRSSPEMRDIQTLARGVILCLKKLEGIEGTSKPT